MLSLQLCRHSHSFQSKHVSAPMMHVCVQMRMGMVILLVIIINGSILVLRQRVTAPFRHSDRLTLFNSTVATVDLNRTTMPLSLCVCVSEKDRVCVSKEIVGFSCLCVYHCDTVCM